MKQVVVKRETIDINVGGTRSFRGSIGLLASVFVLFMLVGCNGDRCTPAEPRIDPRIEHTPAEYGMSFDGTMLVFSSIDQYEKAIGLDMHEENEDGSAKAVKKRIFQEMLKKYGFQDYFSTRTVVEDTLMDDWLGQFLNSDGAIQIADHVYKVDLEKEKVYVIEAQHKASDYNALISGAVGERVAAYSIDDDVLDIVNDPSSEAKEKKGCGGIGGGTYWAYSASDFTDSNTTNNIIKGSLSSGEVWRVNPYVKFFKSGIYHRLSSGYEVWRFASAKHTGGGQLIPNHTFVNDLYVSNIEIHIKNPKAWWRPRPCKSTGGRSAGYHYQKNASSHRETLYVGNRNLNGYLLFVRARAKYSNGNTSGFTNYGGREINFN